MPLKRVFYTIMFIIVCILSFLYDEESLYIVSIILCILPAVSFVLMRYMAAHVEFGIEAGQAVINKRKSEGIYVQVSNKTMFPIPLAEIRIVQKSSFSAGGDRRRYFISIGAEATRRIRCGVSAEYCGNIEFKYERIYIYDMLGIFRCRLRTDAGITISVLPEVYECAGLVTNEHIESFIIEDKYSSVKGGDDSSEIFNVREFVQGDRLNRIHWKLSARQGVLMTKEFGLPLNFSTVVFIELCSQGYEEQQYVNAVIEAAVAISEKFNSIRHFHFLSWFDEGSKEVKRHMITCAEDTYAALGDLYRAVLYKEQGRGISMYNAVYNVEKYADLYYISGVPDEKTYSAVVLTGKGAVLHFVAVTGLDRKLVLGNKAHVGKIGSSKEGVDVSGKETEEIKAQAVSDKKEMVKALKKRPAYMAEENGWYVVDAGNLKETIAGIN